MQLPAGKTPRREEECGPSHGEPLIVVGASVRAAAASAIRAGFRPLAVDRFVDADLVLACETTRRFQRPHEIVDILSTLPPAAWMYTGSLENQPGIVERVAQSRELVGNSATVLRQVRDPKRLFEKVQTAHLLMAEVRDEPPAENSRQWLLKPRRSGGGLGIRHGTRPSTLNPHHYWQRFVEGRPCGALYVAAAGHATLLGVTEQLQGTDWGGAGEFQYCGSVGPLLPTPVQHEQLVQMGECLARNFQLVGLFGVDLILQDDNVWLIEVNPRYTASVEILERILDIRAVQLHVDACRRGILPIASDVTNSTYYGKVILYAGDDLTIDAEHERHLWALNAEATWPSVADIPVCGSRIEAGSPLVTAFAEGRSCADVQQGLRDRMAELHAIFNRASSRWSQARIP